MTDGQLKIKLMTQMTSIKKKITELSDRIDVLETETRSRESSFDSLRAQEKDLYISEEELKIEENFEEETKDIRQKIFQLEKTIDEISPSDDLLGDSEIKEKFVYMNAASQKVNQLYEQLLRVSKPHLIEASYNTKKLGWKSYKREMKKIPSYIRSLKNQEKTETELEEEAERQDLSNKARWAHTFVLGPIAFFTFPFKLGKAVSNVRTLEKYSRLYFSLVESTVHIRNLTAEELENQIGFLVDQQIGACEEELHKLREELSEKEDEKDRLIGNIEFDEESFTQNYNKETFAKEDELEQTRIELEKVEAELEKVKEERSKLLSAEIKKAEEERDPYINPLNDKREVEIPEKILWSYEEAKNSWAQFHSGVYVYSNRTMIENYIRTIIYQLRNYMEFSVIDFVVLDINMALWMADLLSENVKEGTPDILVESLQDGLKLQAENFFELMEARKISIKQVAKDLNEYNRLQREIDSTPMAHKVIFHFEEKFNTFSEKTIQTFKVGSTLGIHYNLFIRREDIREDSLKMLARYVPSIFEVTPTGVSVNSSSDFRDEVLKELATKK